MLLLWPRSGLLYTLVSRAKLLTSIETKPDRGQLYAQPKRCINNWIEMHIMLIIIGRSTWIDDNDK